METLQIKQTEGLLSFWEVKILFSLQTLFVRKYSLGSVTSDVA